MQKWWTIERFLLLALVLCCIILIACVLAGLSYDRLIALAALFVSLIGTGAATFYARRADRSGAEAARIARQQWMQEIKPRPTINPLEPVRSENPKLYQVQFLNSGGRVVRGYAVLHYETDLYGGAFSGALDRAFLKLPVIAVRYKATPQAQAKVLGLLVQDTNDGWWDGLTQTAWTHGPSPGTLGTIAFLEWYLPLILPDLHLASSDGLPNEQVEHLPLSSDSLPTDPP